MSQQVDTVYRIGGDEVAWREAGDEIVVLHTVSSVYFGLGGSGARLWRRLAEGATAEELVAVLTAGAPAETARATADLDAFLEALLGHRLIQRS
jgi:coenzyme PQQ synthesis protein D (PqqD)